VILVDSNMFIYAAGAAPPDKQRSAAFLVRVAREKCMPASIRRYRKIS